jgi:hypothetical protein
MMHSNTCSTFSGSTHSNGEHGQSGSFSLHGGTGAERRRHKKGLSSRWKSFFSLIDDNANERRQDIEGSSNISQAANFLSQRYHNLLKAQNNHFSLGDNPN